MKKEYLLVAEDYDVEKTIACEEHELEGEVMAFVKGELFLETDIISVYEFVKRYNIQRDTTHTLTEEKNDKKT